MLQNYLICMHYLFQKRKKKQNIGYPHNQQNVTVRIYLLLLLQKKKEKCLLLEEELFVRLITKILFLEIFKDCVRQYKINLLSVGSPLKKALYSLLFIDSCFILVKINIFIDLFITAVQLLLLERIPPWKMCWVS